jgi:MPBQ/MSBQ methyltransferase
MSAIESKIRKHLFKQYEGIFLPQQIDKHVNNYVQNVQSDYLIQKITPFIVTGKILDIGSGYGSFVLSALQNGYDAYGIEVEAFEHEISKERASSQSVDPCRFSHGSALALPYSDETFDMVSFWNVLEHISDYKLALKEAKRVLKPGGLIFIIAPNYCSFRKEAHYHLPWLPLFPKSLARLYLKAFDRKTSFLDDYIFYVTNFGVKRFLKSQELSISVDINEKISKGYAFQSSKINFLVSLCRRFKMEKFLIKFIFLVKTNPLAHSIDLIVKK